MTDGPSACAKYLPDPDAFPTETGEQQARWVGDVYTQLFDEECAQPCLGTPADPNADPPVIAVPGVCAGASLTEGCLGCLMSNGCDSQVLGCASCLNSRDASFSNTQCCVENTNCPSSGGLTDAGEIGIAVGVGTVLIIVITVAVIYGRKPRKT